MRNISCAALISIALVLVNAQQPDKPAEEVQKNIQVLKTSLFAVASGDAFHAHFAWRPLRLLPRRRKRKVLDGRQACEANCSPDARNGIQDQQR